VKFGVLNSLHQTQTHSTGSNFTLPNTDYAHKISQVISVKHVLILPEDGSQRIRNMSEFLIVFKKVLIYVDFNLLILS